MEITYEERQLLRELAFQVVEAAVLPIQAERAGLWKSSNSLKPKRAMVLADPQNGWTELVPVSHLKCENKLMRSIEMQLRRTVFRSRHIHDDFVIKNVLPVPLIINKSNYGVEQNVTKSSQSDGAYHIETSIKSYDDLKKLKPAVIEIDWKTSNENTELVKSILGDILKVEIKGIDLCRCGLTRILVHLRGLEQLMFDMYDNPDMLHELMSFLCNEQIREFEFYEKEGALSLNNGPDYITGSGGIAHTDELPSEGHNGRVRLKDMIAWGESQELTGVGPDQFNAFVLKYQLQVLNRFGLVDYGCCESLDKKFDLLLKNIPKLRWVAVSPWCNRKIAAEKLQDKYVYVYKPNPSRICSPNPDFDAAERDILETLDIAKGCAVHIVMKDTSTFHKQIERITRWTDIAIRTAEN